MTLEVGLAAEIDHVVGEADTAAALGSGDLPVLGTPKALALAEAATVAAVAGALDAGLTTVGHRITLEHRVPSPVGATVRARAILTHVDGRALDFEVSISERGETVASGMVARVVVDRASFLDRLR